MKKTFTYKRNFKYFKGFEFSSELSLFFSFLSFFFIFLYFLFIYLFLCLFIYLFIYLFILKYLKDFSIHAVGKITEWCRIKS